MKHLFIGSLLIMPSCLAICCDSIFTFAFALAYAIALYFVSVKVRRVRKFWRRYNRIISRFELGVR